MALLDRFENVSETAIRLIFAGNDATNDWGSAKNLTDVSIFRKI
jgi:hypothetical protein